MIAYKTYAQAPQNQTPTGIPPEWPWQMQGCSESEAEGLTNDGFTVVSDEDYDAYLATYQEAFDTWIASIVVVPQEITLRQLRLALLNDSVSLSSFEDVVLVARGGTNAEAIATQLELTSAQMDNLFIAAADL